MHRKLSTFSFLYFETYQAGSPNRGIRIPRRAYVRYSGLKIPKLPKIHQKINSYAIQFNTSTTHE